MEEIIKNLSLQFFKELDIKIKTIAISKDDIKNIFNISVKTDESGLLIGNNGVNIEAIQNILKIMSSKKLDERIKIYLKVNDYSKTNDERLYDYIDKEINYLKKVGTDIKLPYYSAYERKKIHSYIAYKKDDAISSKSIGVGKQRRIFLSIKNKKLTIDINGTDI